MRIRHGAAVLSLAALLTAAFAPAAASAMPPAKAGWWNVATFGGAALPMPTTAAGDLHVGQSPTGPTAYAAVAYDLAGQSVSSAVLELKITANSAVGTPSLRACRTKDTAWKAEENGPITDAPAYDCSKSAVAGLVSATGDTVTFLLDAAQQVGGTYSLAIVPTDGATAFQVDLTKPGPESLTPSDVSAPQGTTTTSGTTSTYVPPAGSGVSAAAPLTGGAASLAPTAPLAVAQAPAVAAPTVPAPQAAAPPYVAPAVTAASTQPISNRDRYEAGTLLALLAGALVWAYQQKAPQPRLIGGMARSAGAVPEPVPVDPTPRGIGRFASVRMAPARRLV